MTTKYKQWEFDDDLTVEDMINLTMEGRKPAEQFKFMVDFWESRRIKKDSNGKYTKKIDIKVKYRDLVKIQEAVLQSFL